MAWLLLSIAILAEIAGTLMLKASDGLSKLLPSVGVAVGYLTAFALMSQSMKKLDVGITYAIWSGVGVRTTSLQNLAFDNRNLRSLPVDTSLSSKSRQVPNAIFSLINPSTKSQFWA